MLGLTATAESDDFLDQYDQEEKSFNIERHNFFEQIGNDSAFTFIEPARKCQHPRDLIFPPLNFRTDERNKNDQISVPIASRSGEVKDAIFYSEESGGPQMSYQYPSEEERKTGGPEKERRKREIQQEFEESAQSAKSQREKKKVKAKSNKYKTKNMLQFFLKQVKNYIIRVGKDDTQIRKIWKGMGELSPSMEIFRMLFNHQRLRNELKQMFKSRFLLRQIVKSGVEQKLKRCYIKYVNVLRRGFISRRLEFLN